MKTKKMLSMLLALAMVASLFTVPAFAANELNGVSIGGMAKVGETFTATPAFDSGSEEVTYKWYHAATNDKVSALKGGTTTDCTEITGTSGDTCVLPTAAEGKYVYVVATGGTTSAKAAAVSSTVIAASTGGSTPAADTDPETFAEFAEKYGYIADTGVYTDVKSDITIDFDKELIYWSTKPSDETKLPGFYTVDGTKWAAMKFTIEDNKAAAEENGPQKEFQKLLDKGATSLQFTSALDNKTKEPQKAVAATKTDGVANDDAILAATTYKWGKINARPKLSGFKPNYAPAALKTFNANSIADGENGAWLPVDGKGEQKAEQLQIAFSSDGKNPAANEYGVIDMTEGIAVQGYDSKPGKVNYLIRVAPTKASAASKAKKISASTVTKAPNLKIDYKKAVVKFKGDMVYGYVSLAIEDGETNMMNVANFTQISTKTIVKDDAFVKTGMPIVESGVENKSLSYGNDYGVRIVNTEKKPVSKIQPLSVAAVGSPYEVNAGLTVKGTSIKTGKTYEIYDTVKKKWGGSVKAEKSGIFEVRLKNTAKYDAKTNKTSGDCVSGSMFLGVIVGKDAKDKPAVTAYSFLANDGKTTNGKDTASAATHAVYPATMADLVTAIAIDKDTTAAGITKEPHTVVVKPGTGAKTITVTASGTVATNLTFTDGQNDSKFTVVALPALDESTAVAVDYACTGYDEFYSPTFTVNVTVDNKGILAAKKTVIEADETLTGLIKEYAKAELTDTGWTGTTKTAIEGAVKTAIGSVFVSTCKITTEVEITKEPTTAAVGSYKITITVERGDQSITITKTGADKVKKLEA